MSTDTITLTEADIERCRTKKGGFTRKTVEAFGLSWVPPKGWTRRLRGVVVSREKYEQALNGAKDDESLPGLGLG